MMEIRLAAASDFKHIYPLICELEDEIFDQQRMRSIFEENLYNERIIYLVGLSDNIPVSFLSCHIQRLLHHNDSIAEIQELFVRSDFRKQSIGHQLVEQLKLELRERKILQLEVTVNQIRIDAKRFYQSNGFEETHTKLVLTMDK